MAKGIRSINLFLSAFFDLSVKKQMLISEQVLTQSQEQVTATAQAKKISMTPGWLEKSLDFAAELHAAKAKGGNTPLYSSALELLQQYTLAEHAALLQVTGEPAFHTLAAHPTPSPSEQIDAAWLTKALEDSRIRLEKRAPYPGALLIVPIEQDAFRGALTLEYPNAPGLDSAFCTFLECARRELNNLVRLDSLSRQLEHAQSNLQTVLENIHEGVALFTSHSQHALINTKAAKILGLSSTQPKPLLLVDTIQRLSGHAASTNTRESSEWVLGHPVSQRFQVCSVPLNPETNPGCLWVFDDVTDKVQGADKLRVAEESLASAFNHAAIGIAWVALDGRCLRANKALCKLLWYPEEDLTQKTLQEITHPDDLGVDSEHLQNLLEDRVDSYQVEKRYFKRGGEIVWALLNMSLVHDPLGAPLHFIAYIQDITGLKQAEDARIALERSLQSVQKTESLNRMAGAIAHHFNNQLQAVIGFLELTLADLPPDLAMYDNIHGALFASQRATEVSRLLLSYLGQVSGIQETIDLTDTCRNIVPVLEQTLPPSTTVEAHLPAERVAIQANPPLLQQILINLVTNSAESYGKYSGHIQIKLKRLSPAEIPATPRFPLSWQPQAEHYACLEVSDCGCGIPEADLERIFEPFFSDKFAGRGMGLSVVLGIVRAHQGCITVSSRVGKGSTFQLFFPLLTEHAPTATEKPTSLQERFSGTVLVVDDDPFVLRLARITLTNLGFTVLEANNGPEAIELFRQHTQEVRFVLSDISMPRMDGWHTMLALRNLRPDVPVILASGHDQPQDQSENHDLSPQAFLNKPYRTAELLQVLQHILKDPGSLSPVP